MSVVSAFMVPGSPLPYLRPDNPPWKSIVDGYAKARETLNASGAEVVLVYSTQWLAVLDELWQTRPQLEGVHVDENWYEFGDLPFDIDIDVSLAEACVNGSKEIEVSSKGVNYEGFPIDTGTIVMSNFLNPDKKYPLVIAANNVYHDPETTQNLARMAVEAAEKQDKKVAVVGVGGLSGTIFREEIDIAEDHVASKDDDDWNKRILDLIEKGDRSQLDKEVPEYAQNAKVDMGFKHLSWLMGGMGDRYAGAKVLAYGPTYGSGAAVIEFTLG